MNKDFEGCCSLLADMIIKYAPEIKEEVEVCMMIKDSIDDEKVSRHPYDNASMERFYNTFKSNFYNITSFSNVEMMDELTMKYINWYNYVCPHSYNNYLTPMEARYR